MELNHVSGVRTDINEMLSKLREVSHKSTVFSEGSKISEKHGFEDMLAIAKNAMGSVSKTQIESENIKNAFISGSSNVSMSQVIVASQKSKLAFEGLLAVRNKILEAYKEIMNMPV